LKELISLRTEGFGAHPGILLAAEGPLIPVNEEKLFACEGPAIESIGTKLFFAAKVFANQLAQHLNFA
jgi:hypothetical protein